jgi:hypothetical protein
VSVSRASLDSAFEQSNLTYRTGTPCLLVHTNIEYFVVSNVRETYLYYVCIALSIEGLYIHLARTWSHTCERCTKQSR